MKTTKGLRFSSVQFSSVYLANIKLRDAPVKQTKRNQWKWDNEKETKKIYENRWKGGWVWPCHWFVRRWQLKHLRGAFSQNTTHPKALFRSPYHGCVMGGGFSGCTLAIITPRRTVGMRPAIGRSQSALALAIASLWLDKIANRNKGDAQ